MLSPGSTPAGRGAEPPLRNAILSQDTSCAGAGAVPSSSRGSCTGSSGHLHPPLGSWGEAPPSPTAGLAGGAPHPPRPRVPLSPRPHVPASPAHLEADVPLLAAQAGQHEEDEGEEPREGNGHDGQRGGPGELAKGGAVCGDRRGSGSGQGGREGSGSGQGGRGDRGEMRMRRGGRARAEVTACGGTLRLTGALAGSTWGAWGSQHRCAPFAGSAHGWGAQQGPQSPGRTPPAARRGTGAESPQMQGGNGTPWRGGLHWPQGLPSGGYV